VEHNISVIEFLVGIIGIGLTISFGAWGAIVKKAAEKMETQVERAVNEISKLREEIHQDRLINERRFARLERISGLSEGH